MRCGRDTHYINDCYATTDVDGAIICESRVSGVSGDYCDDNVKITSVPMTPIKTANNKGITPKTTIFKVSNNNGNEIIEFSNIRDYGRWAESDIALRGSWKIEVS
jgi:hypothetical protein